MFTSCQKMEHTSIVEAFNEQLCSIFRLKVQNDETFSAGVTNCCLPPVRKPHFEILATLWFITSCPLWTCTVLLKKKSEGQSGFTHYSPVHYSPNIMHYLWSWCIALHRLSWHTLFSGALFSQHHALFIVMMHCSPPVIMAHIILHSSCIVIYLYSWCILTA